MVGGREMGGGETRDGCRLWLFIYLSIYLSYFLYVIDCSSAILFMAYGDQFSFFVFLH